MNMNMDFVELEYLSTIKEELTIASLLFLKIT